MAASRLLMATSCTSAPSLASSTRGFESGCWRGGLLIACGPCGRGEKRGWFVQTLMPSPAPSHLNAADVYLPPAAVPRPLEDQGAPTGLRRHGEGSRAHARQRARGISVDPRSARACAVAGLSVDRGADADQVVGGSLGLSADGADGGVRVLAVASVLGVRESMATAASILIQNGRAPVVALTNSSIAFNRSIGSRGVLTSSFSGNPKYRLAEASCKAGSNGGLIITSPPAWRRSFLLARSDRQQH